MAEDSDGMGSALPTATSATPPVGTAPAVPSVSFDVPAMLACRVLLNRRMYTRAAWAHAARPLSPCAFHVRDGDYFGVATILFLGAVMGAGASQIGGRRLHFRRLPN